MVNKDVLCSVIIPAYNAENFIEQTVKCVMNQTYKNLEIIIVNDCSKDNTLDIIKEMQAKDERIIVEDFKDNVGVNEARNKGVIISGGEYIAFLDADDLWREDKIEKQLAAIKDNNAVLCCTGCGFVNEQGNPMTSKHKVPKVITLKSLFKKNHIICSSVLIKKTAIATIKMEGDNIHEDYLAWLRILREYGQAVGINESLTFYRILSGSRSSNKLKGIGKTFRVYRLFGLNIIKSFYYTCWYIINGIKKHSKIKAIK